MQTIDFHKKLWRFSYFYVFKNYEYYKNQGEEERMITLLQKLEDKGKIYDEETISKVAPAFSFINFKNTLNQGIIFLFLFIILLGD